MIIRDDIGRRIRLRRKLLIYLLPPATLLIILAAFSFFKTPDNSGATYFCSAEEVRTDTSGVSYFTHNGQDFSNPNTRSSDEAYSGSYSSLVNLENEYGLSFETTEIHPGEEWEVSVWRKSPFNNGHFVADGSWGLYKSVRSSGELDGQWEKLTIKFAIPLNVKQGLLKIYCWNPENEGAWFDDLKIVRKGNPEALTLPDYTESEVENLNLILGEKGLKKITDKRNKAFQKGLLISAPDDFVKAKLETGKKQMQARVRLKGDWTDHLIGKKWSFRVELAPGEAWNRMLIFSLQNPATRYYLSEWVYHKLLEQEDILTTRYDLVNLKINNVTRGIYAYEEHFVKQLPESRKRREGPILKLNEAGMWEVMEFLTADGLPMDRSFASQESAQVDGFKVKRAMGDSVLRRQFEMAQSLMQTYREKRMSIWDLFDVERMARYYAVVDLCKAQHGFIWHNQRFYFNPTISKLEPIGFDGYTYTGPYNWLERPFIAWGRANPRIRDDYFEAMFERFFKDEKFIALYVRELDKVTHPDYAMSVVQTLLPEIREREALIQKEVPGYQYDVEFLPQNAKKIRAAMQPLPNASVKAYYEGVRDGKHLYRLLNFHSLPLKMVGVGKSSKKISPFLDPPLLPAFTRGQAANQDFASSAEAGGSIFFRLPGMDTLFSAEVIPFGYPEAITPEQELFSGLEISSNDLYTVEDSIVRIRQGKHQVRKHILIPPGYRLEIEAGTELDLLNNSYLISKSDVTFRGTEDDPVIIHSSDKTGSIAVLQAPGKSWLGYTIFSNLNNLDYKGWMLSGAVTFYESQVELERCSFTTNHCEDALNIVRSHFKMLQCTIENTFADGLDSDFCSGFIQNSTFIKTGNDAIDFSGSTVTIKSVTIDQPGDKGISVGEESNITVEWASISGANLGLASKDLSRVTVESIELKNVKQGFAAYQKKPEYGPATIKVNNYSEEEVETLYILQKDSKLNLKGREIVGKR